MWIFSILVSALSCDLSRVEICFQSGFRPTKCLAEYSCLSRISEHEFPLQGIKLSGYIMTQDSKEGLKNLTPCNMNSYEACFLINSIEVVECVSQLRCFDFVEINPYIAKDDDFSKTEELVDKKNQEQRSSDEEPQKIDENKTGSLFEEEGKLDHTENEVNHGTEKLEKTETNEENQETEKSGHTKINEENQETENLEGIKSNEVVQEIEKLNDANPNETSQENKGDSNGIGKNSEEIKEETNSQGAAHGGLNKNVKNTEDREGEAKEGSNDYKNNENEDLEELEVLAEAIESVIEMFKEKVQDKNNAEMLKKLENLEKELDDVKGRLESHQVENPIQNIEKLNAEDLQKENIKESNENKLDINEEKPGSHSKALEETEDNKESLLAESSHEALSTNQENHENTENQNQENHENTERQFVSKEETQSKETSQKESIKDSNQHFSENKQDHENTSHTNTENSKSDTFSDKKTEQLHSSLPDKNQVGHIENPEDNKEPGKDNENPREKEDSKIVEAEEPSEEHNEYKNQVEESQKSASGEENNKTAENKENVIENTDKENVIENTDEENVIENTDKENAIENTDKESETNVSNKEQENNTNFSADNNELKESSQTADSNAEHLNKTQNLLGTPEFLEQPLRSCESDCKAMCEKRENYSICNSDCLSNLCKQSSDYLTVALTGIFLFLVVFIIYLFIQNKSMRRAIENGEYVGAIYSSIS